MGTIGTAQSGCICPEGAMLQRIIGGMDQAEGNTDFMKGDLLPIMGEDQMIQELPPAFPGVLEDHDIWQK